MHQFLTWLLQPYRGSNRISLWLRKYIERLKLPQVVGINLAGVAFFAGVVMPQVSDITSSLELQKDTQETIVDVVPTQSTYQWPMSHFGLSQRFSMGHPGIDLTAPLGTALFPVSNGWVAWVNTSYLGYGKHLFIEHDGGVKSLYAHLSYVNVRPGETVTKETQIGEIGATGWATGYHVHLEIYQDGVPINPLEVLPEIK